MPTTQILRPPSAVPAKVLALVQARMGSTRLPGKALLPLGDRCLLDWVVDRARRAERLDGVVVATTDAPSDDRLADWSRQRDIACFRGSENDVLGRFAAAARTFDAGLIVRVNGDNPLVDPQYIDKLVEEAQAGGADYVSYRRADTTPVMLTALSFFAEAITRACLERADREIADAFEREHVTLGIYRRPEQFRVQWLPVPVCCNDPRLRFTIDTPADLEMLGEAVRVFGPRTATVTAEEIVEVTLRRPEWLAAMAAQNTRQPKSVRGGAWRGQAVICD